MRSTLIVAALIAASVASAQDAAYQRKNFAGVGVSVDADTQKVVSTGFYARDVASGWLSFVTFADFVPTTDQQRGRRTSSEVLATRTESSVMLTSGSIGAAPRVVPKSWPFGLYVPIACGFATSSKNVGWSWTSGLMLQLRSGVGFSGRVIKSSVNMGNDYAVMAGVTFGFGF